MLKKTCSRCREELPTSDFGRENRTKSGLKSACRPCEAARQREWYAACPERRKKKIATAAKWHATNRERSLELKRANGITRRNRERESGVYAEIRRKARRKNRERYPQKARARYAVGNAIRSGKLVRQPCLVCGNEKSEAHHADYQKTLDVMWLCRLHHRAWHRVFLSENAESVILKAF